MPGCTDVELLFALRDRDPTALERLYDAYGRRAFGLAFRIVGESGAAEDAVQEAFLDVWQHAERLNPDRGNIGSLLLTVVHHKAIDRLRRQRGQSRLYNAIDITLVQETLASSGDMAATTLDRDVVRQALSCLPPEQCQAVELAYFAGYTQVEIADITRVPLGTVKSRLRLALERLRYLLMETVGQ